VNEDRFHVDEARGLFIVVDGVGGQAAGGKAADVALSMLRERLERETGPVAERIREAIAIANNEIYRLAASRPEWDGMACVLTIAVVKDGMATIGHVGDTRLYRLRSGGIQKITRDHSPVGEREDASEITELEAMRHPRRNEVYRDVGSEPHTPDDPDFADVLEIPFEGSDALLLCSDGLSDLVDSATIARTVNTLAGQPRAVARALIDAANAAGGKDNVTVVYLEAENFAASCNVSSVGQAEAAAEVPSTRRSSAGRLTVAAAIVVALAVAGFLVYRSAGVPFWPNASAAFRSWLNEPVDASVPSPLVLTVGPGESIGAVLSRAQPGSEVVVEPGEYQEHVTLTNNIRLVSRVPRGATIRLPAGASDVQPEPAVRVTGSSSGSLEGFTIVGDARTPLGVGVLVAGTGVSLVDIDVSGAASAAVVFAPKTSATLIGSDIHDNPGAALSLQAGATPRITHNVFRRNGLSQRTPATFVIDAAAMPVVQRNVFLGVRPDVFAALDSGRRLALARENWFLDPARP
jgi:serine/threonine protein phosphatase PrpC